MAKLRRDQVMVATEMIERGVSVRQVARQLGVAESGLRYRLRRPADAPDGRQDRASVLDDWEERVDAVLARFGDARVDAQGTGHCPARTLYAVLRREHGFGGSYQAVRRYSGGGSRPRRRRRCAASRRRRACLFMDGPLAFTVRRRRGDPLWIVGWPGHAEVIVDGHTFLTALTEAARAVLDACHRNAWGGPDADALARAIEQADSYRAA